jgi:hypothetical protein
MLVAGLYARPATWAQAELLAGLDPAPLWTFMGPASAWSRMTAFGPRGGRRLVRGSIDVGGQSQGLKAARRELQIATLVPAPRDPPCSPTRRAVRRIRWADGRMPSSRP